MVAPDIPSSLKNYFHPALFRSSSCRAEGLVAGGDTGVSLFHVRQVLCASGASAAYGSGRKVDVPPLKACCRAPDGR